MKKIGPTIILPTVYYIFLSGMILLLITPVASSCTIEQFSVECQSNMVLRLHDLVV